MTRLTKSGSSQPGGCSSDGSSYPESERAYFKRVYGSDHLNQLHDGHQMRYLLRRVKPEKKAEVKRMLNQLSHLPCANDPGLTQPGRSAYSLKQLKENLSLYCREQCRSLRWNEHYQKALQTVSEDMFKLLGHDRCLHPIPTEAVAESESFRRNLDKNAGFMAFETGKRSKGENVDEAIEWCNLNQANIAEEGRYGLPLVISHRSSNSKPLGNGTWKWKCRIILMQDVRALLLDGRFALPFTTLFQQCPWGEGGMTQEDVRGWIHRARNRYDSWFSSDYSKFDVSQAAWLLEDVFNVVIRPLFGELSPMDERLFSAMVESYIHKEIHAWDGIYYAHGCQLSGSLLTYACNTVVNQIITRTVLLMQGCDLSAFHSLMCGDDNLTYYSSRQPWSRELHCRLIRQYFGIVTTLDEKDVGNSKTSPSFLSRIWTDDGEERDIAEVLWNLVYPERFRNYDPAVTGVPSQRAEALVLSAACREQAATMRRYFNVDAIYADADVRRSDDLSLYHALANLGTGFRTPWINWQFDLSA